LSKIVLVAASAVLVGASVSGCAGTHHSPSEPAPAPTAAPTPPSVSGQWALVWADEFDAPGNPDPARWTHDIGYIANQEAQYYTSRSENVRVEDGLLVIEARKEPWMGYAYTSARLKTQGLAQFLYGRVEFRARLPTGRGTWPALWMLGSNIGQVGWPTCGEIDIMENVGFDPLKIHGTVHTDAYNHTLGNHRSGTVEASPPPWEDFHVYSMEWTPDRIDIFLDGERYFTFENEGTGTAAWPFDQPHFIIVNLAIGGSWGGQRGIDDSLFPHRMFVDYVRVYERKQSP
jgi:beta-glucanase (GH16 family)